MVARMTHRRPMLPILAAVAVVLAIAPHGRGGDDAVVGDDRPAGQRIDLGESLEETLTEYGHRRLEVEAVRDQVFRRIVAAIDAVDRVCHIEPSRRERCVAAAGLEAESAVRAIERLRARFAGRSIAVDVGGGEGWEEFERELDVITPVAARARFPMLFDSFPRRVVDGVLDERQRAAWEEAADRRRHRRARALVENTLASLGEDLGLSRRQHEALLALCGERPVVVDERRAMLVLEDPAPEHVGVVALDRLDPAAVEGVLTPRQWRRWSACFGDMKPAIAVWRSRGLIEEPDEPQSR